MNNQYVAAQPGLWLAMLTGGRGEPWAIDEQPVVAWDLKNVDADRGPMPIAIVFGTPYSGDCWAVRYPDGTYWLPHCWLRTSAKDEVLTALVKQKQEQEQEAAE
jgi:hypothetical protein